MAATGPETEATTLHAAQSASQSPRKSAASDTASAAVPSPFSSIQISVLTSEAEESGAARNPLRTVEDRDQSRLHFRRVRPQSSIINRIYTN
ncbi:hypothetical protein ACLKA7_005932 [Drosophila subpalustris]